jgi:hypothetical protein
VNVAEVKVGCDKSSLQSLKYSFANFFFLNIARVSIFVTLLGSLTAERGFLIKSEKFQHNEDYIHDEHVFMLKKRFEIIKIILINFCEIFNRLWERLDDGTAQRCKNIFQETPARSELLHLWESLCGKTSSWWRYVMQRTGERLN